MTENKKSEKEGFMMKRREGKDVIAILSGVSGRWMKLQKMWLDFARQWSNRREVELLEVFSHVA